MERLLADGNLGDIEVSAASGSLSRWSAVNPETFAYDKPLTILSRDLAHLLHDRAVVLAEIERTRAVDPETPSSGPWLFTSTAARLTFLAQRSNLPGRSTPA